MSGEGPKVEVRWPIWLSGSHGLWVEQGLSVKGSIKVGKV